MNGERVRNRDIDLMGDLNKNKSQQFLSSPLGYSFTSVPIACTNAVEERENQGVEEENDLGGSMGPLLNGAWAYEH